jgi:hypothetical protein
MSLPILSSADVANPAALEDMHEIKKQPITNSPQGRQP